eukprot:CCRYP_017624-RA/>CCRYP_017624-RA protein AED:0.45 eAED:0.45 QI:0/0/0/1/0/0/2/0/81
MQVCDNAPLNLMRKVETSVPLLCRLAYARLPVGLKCSPDIAQFIMESVLSGIDDADVYIDDTVVNDWDHHVQLLATILRRL